MVPRFGTDGIHGVANLDLTPELVLALGSAAVPVLVPSTGGTRPVFVVGRDTRASSPMLAAALAAGLAAAGADVHDVGVIPTGGVAILVRELDAAGGAVVSASHNPAEDNGVKFFTSGGGKLAEAVEASIEANLESILGSPPERDTRPSGGAVGRVTAAATDVARYVDVLAKTVRTRLDGLKVVVDAAHGAASTVGPDVLRAAGAEVVAIAVEPDGVNINAGCGATEPAHLAAAVVAEGAALGVAFDGDADRCIAADAHGNIVDGDQIMAVLAVDRHAAGALPGDAIVATVMSNLGLRLAMRERGIRVVECPVGDRNVLLAMERNGLVLGGEQSGHVVLADVAPTGDGILTALALCQTVVRAGRPLADLAAVMQRLPQVLVNVPLADRGRLDEAAELWAAVREVEATLGESGRVLVRPSGTEPKLRLMVEAPTHEAAAAAVERLALAAAALA